MPCSCCIHPDRDDIDAAIVAGESVRSIGRRFDVSPWSVSRHHNRHLSPSLAAVRVERVRQDAASLLQRTESLIARTERLLEAAEKDGKVTAALAAVRELRGLLELLGKASGELDTRPQVTVNLLASPEWIDARAVILSALLAYPEARAAVAGRLLELEAGPS